MNVKQLLLCLLVLLGNMTASASISQINNIWYSLSSGRATVIEPQYYNGFKIPYSGFIRIPASVELSNQTYNVTSIQSSAFKGCTGLQEVVIPNSVTSIGSSAFEGCTGLKEVSIGCGVTSIGKKAFDGCENLTKVFIGTSVTTFGNDAFRQCNNLTSVYVKNPIPVIISENLFSNPSEATLYVPLGSKATYEDADGWKSFGNIVEQSYSIYFDDNIVTTLCKKWDTNHDGLLNVEEAAAVKSLGTVFQGELITSFNELAYFTGLTSIGANAFQGCKALTNITIPNNVTSIGDMAFSDAGLISLTIPENVTSIGESAFESCINLESVTIPNSVTSIGESAFNDCFSLKSVTIPNSVTSIGKSAFESCEGLTLVTIPNSVTCIEESTFYYCI